MNIETLAIHAGRSVDAATGAVTPPIHLSTTFERAEDGSLPQGFLYIRNANPNRGALEAALAALEDGAAAAAFASGSAATNTLLQALGPATHLITPYDAYNGSTQLFTNVFAAWGGAVSQIDLADLSHLEAVLNSPRAALRQVVWIETPSNPMLRISDIAAICAIAHRYDATVVCDNIWATPLGQRPFELGVDVIMHSTTKYLGGHSDVLGGALITREENVLWERIRQVQILGGAVPSPFDCWLIQRGLQTLPYRVRAQSEHATQIVEWLTRQPQISHVHYPSLTTHPGHAVAKRQMRLWGGMISIQVAAGQAAALALLANLRLWTRATSLGGAESLIEHRATTEGPTSTTPSDLLRLSVGLEHPDDLIADLAQAMQRL